MREVRAGVWRLVVDAGVNPATGKRRQRTKIVHGGPRAAERELAAFARQAAADRDDWTSAASGVSVAGLCSQYVDSRKLAGRSPSTVDEYRRQVEREIAPRFGNLPADKLTPEMIDRWYLDFMAGVNGDGTTTAPRSSARAHRYHSLLHAAYKWGVKRRLVAANPVAAATAPGQPKPRTVLPTPADVRAMLAGFAEDSPEMGACLRLAAATGVRRGVAVAWQWQDVDWGTGVVTAARKVVRVGSAHQVLPGHKTGDRPQTLAIDKGTLDALAAHRANMEARADLVGGKLAEDAYLFSDDGLGREPWRPERVTRAWDRVRGKAGIRAEIRLHDLRHFMASELLAAGANVRDVSARLAHSQTSTTLNMYAHAMPAWDIAAARTIGELLDG